MGTHHAASDAPNKGKMRVIINSSVNEDFPGPPNGLGAVSTTREIRDENKLRTPTQTPAILPKRDLDAYWVCKSQVLGNMR